MSEKLKLTKKQAEAVEHFREAFLENKDTAMANISLIDAIRNGYEIEPEFKVGDWVVHTLSGALGNIEEIKNVINNNTQRIVVDGILCYPDSLRHATPEEIAEEKERRWWKKHGREPWELRKGDVLLWDKIPSVCTSLTSVEGNHVQSADINTTIDFIKDKCKVVCFAEDRLDGDFDE